MKRPHWIGRLVVLTLGLPAVARGEVPVPVEPGVGTASHHRISLQLGLGAPLGAVGLGWAYAPSERWRIETGLGLGFTGPLLSVMPGLSFGAGRDRFIMGAGLALSHDLGEFAAWLNAELAGYEHVYASGFSLFLGGGVTMPFQHSRAGSGKGGVAFDPFIPLPMFRFGLGSWVGGGGQARAAAGGTGFASSSAATSPAAPRRHQRISLQGAAGDPAATANVAAAWALAPLDWLRIEAAVNLLGWMSQYDWYPSLMPMIALGGRHRFVAGAGVAWQHRESRVCDADCAILGVEPLGYEYTFATGFTMFTGGGFTYPLVGGKTNPDYPQDGPMQIASPYIKAGLGWWL